MVNLNVHHNAISQIYTKLFNVSSVARLSYRVRFPSFRETATTPVACFAAVSPGGDTAVSTHSDAPPGTVEMGDDISGNARATLLPTAHADRK